MLMCGIFYVMTGGDFPSPGPSPAPDVTTDNDGQLSYKGNDVIITKHAACRMGCREIDSYEVQQVLANGRVNQRKSNPDDSRGCPTVALEAKTRDGQTVRAIVADCQSNPKLVTVIDLDNKYNCHCD